MNIDNINIYKIIEDYLEYIYIMESLNLEMEMIRLHFGCGKEIILILGPVVR